MEVQPPRLVTRAQDWFPPYHSLRQLIDVGCTVVHVLDTKIKHVVTREVRGKQEAYLFRRSLH